MKIIELITGTAILEDLQAGGGSVGVGTANTDSIIMKPPDPPMKKLPKAPQVGYGIQIGNKVIPTPGYNSDNDLGQINKVEGG
jgi:hypothetical protein